MNKIFLIIAILFSVNIIAQEYPSPVANEFNQAELRIENISVSETNTVVTLSVVNKMESGAWYCADENIYLYSKSLNKRYYITSTENIPTCPDKYEFKRIGEKLTFKLVFPSIKYAGARIDLIEDCSNSCFFFKGIILDNKLSGDIHLFDFALDQYENGDKSVAKENFKKIISDLPINPTHVYGFAYSYLYKISMSEGKGEEAEKWKSEFMSSNLPNKQYYLKNF